MTTRKIKIVFEVQDADTKAVIFEKSQCILEVNTTDIAHQIEEKRAKMFAKAQQEGTVAEFEAGWPIIECAIHRKLVNELADAAIFTVTAAIRNKIVEETEPLKIGVELIA